MADWSDDEPVTKSQPKPSTSQNNGFKSSNARDDWGDSPSTRKSRDDWGTNNDGWGNEKKNDKKDQDDFWGAPPSKSCDANNNDDDGEELTEKIEVESNKVGRIIGSGGSVIKELQSEFRVKIDICKEENENGMKEVTVTGSKGNVSRCLDEIKSKTGGGRGGPRDFDDGGEKITETIEIEPSQVGRIVGGGGAIIKELQSEFRVKIDICREDNDNGKRDVSVTGSQKSVTDCIENIKSRISGGGGRRDIDEGEKVTETIEIEPSQVGKVVGSGGSVIKELQSEFHVKIDICKEDNENGKRNVDVTGSQQNVSECLADIKARISGEKRSARHDEGGWGDGQGGSSNDDEITETLEVDVGKVGRIVGGGGAVINELQSNHEVKINISKEEDDGKKKVEIVGAPGNVKKALAEIKSKIGDGGDGAPREFYIPEVVDQDDLYSNAISAGINFSKYDNIEVEMTGERHENIKPIQSFDESNLRALVKDNVARSGYSKPTPIQKYAIPIIEAGRDLMGCAQTGSGKTAAFVLPIINNILKGEYSNDSINCLIVAPTRELAIQIFDEARKFSRGSYLKVCIAYGGTAVRHQSSTIESGCHILIATPGRLSDFIGKGIVKFNSLKYLVLDEADRMLDMGFKTKIEEIANHSTFNKNEVQTLMFSATFPKEIQRLASSFLKDYIFLTVGIVGGASDDVSQEIIEVTKFKKREKLMEILRETVKDENRKILVFVETKKSADFLASFLSESHISSTSIHGDRLQRERELALGEFRRGIRKVLVATSVAARGLDIKNVTDVINYDLPKSIEDYVHRIGRTGRVGNMGSAISFYDPDFDSDLKNDLVASLKAAKRPIPEFFGSVDYCGMEEDVFGGTDIRKQAVAPGKQQEPEEEW